jgi:hypothetical protein
MASIDPDDRVTHHPALWKQELSDRNASILRWSEADYTDEREFSLERDLSYAALCIRRLSTSRLLSARALGMALTLRKYPRRPDSRNYSTSRRNSVLRYIDPAQSSPARGAVLTFTNKIVHFFTLVVTDVIHAERQHIYFNSDHDSRRFIYEWPLEGFLATAEAIAGDAYEPPRQARKATKTGQGHHDSR